MHAFFVATIWRAMVALLTHFVTRVDPLLASLKQLQAELEETTAEVDELLESRDGDDETIGELGAQLEAMQAELRKAGLLSPNAANQALGYQAAPGHANSANAAGVLAAPTDYRRAPGEGGAPAAPPHQPRSLPYPLDSRVRRDTCSHTPYRHGT